MNTLKDKKVIIVILVFLLLTLVFIAPVSAHPGRTASDGCHYCRTNCDRWGVPWNARHCHGGYSTPYTTPYSTPYSTPYITPPDSTTTPLTPGKVHGTQTQNDDSSFWTGLITLGILGGGLYWVIKKIKNAFNKDHEDDKEV